MRTSFFIFFLLIEATLYAQIHEVCPSCPLNTLQKAVEKAQAHDTIRLKAGNYSVQNLSIEKPLTLLGDGKATLNGEFKGEILSVKSNDFHIKNVRFANVGHSFTKDNAAIRLEKCENFSIVGNVIENAYFGIIIHKGKRGLVAENKVKGQKKDEFNTGNAIHMWDSREILVKNNEVSNSRDGIYLQFTSNSTIEGNKSFLNLRYGLHFMFSNDNLYKKNTFEENGAGVAVMFSRRIKMLENLFQKNWGTASYGVLLKEIYDSEIEGNTFYQNTIGINGESCNRVNYKENVFSENGWGIRIKGACYANHFWDNNFLNNTFDVSYNNNVNDNTFKNNYWSEYTGYDLDRNEIGDVPYRPVKLFSYIANRTPESIVLLRSLFVDIVNFSEKVAPVFTPENLIDHTPRMRPFQKKK